MFFFKGWLVDHWCIITIFLCFANLIDRGLPNTAGVKDGRKTANKHNRSLEALFWWSKYPSICSELFIHQTKWVSETSSRPDERVVRGGFAAVRWVFACPAEQPAFVHNRSRKPVWLLEKRATLLLMGSWATELPLALCCYSKGFLLW